MPAKKSAKKTASKQKKSVKKAAKKVAKKVASKSKKATSAKKAVKKTIKKPAKKLAKKQAKKAAKKPVSKKKSASAAKKVATKKKPAVKAKKVVAAKKPARKQKKPVIPKPVIKAPPRESGFVDVGRFETEIYEPDPEIKEEFAEAAVMGDSSRKFLLDELRENAPAESPVLSGGDIDAAWDQSDASGEESVGGSNPTPDQDVVDELGKAVGLTYKDDEPLATTEKLTERDEHRWELEPESSEDFDERNKE